MTAERGEDVSNRVDPDPFVAIGTFFSGAAIVLNLVMIWQTYGTQRSSAAAESTRRNRLNHIHDEMSQLRLQLTRLIRAVERGSPNSDRQFYDAPYRLHASRLELSSQEFAEYAEALSNALMRCGNLSSWIHNVISFDPGLASDLGRVLNEIVGDVATELNRAMELGRPNRTVVVEANRVLDALAEAINRELDSGNA